MGIVKNWDSLNQTPERLVCLKLIETALESIQPQNIIQKNFSLKVNVLRGIGLSAENSKKTECKNGHLFSPENTYLANGKYGIQRQCRKCKVICKKERN